MNLQDINFDASETAHLRAVMADDVNHGALIEYTDDVYLSRLHADRNLWELVVDGDAVATFAPERIGTSDSLARWINARTDIARSDGDEQAEPVEEERWSGGFQ